MSQLTITNTKQTKDELVAFMNKMKGEGKLHISFSEFSLFNKCGHKHLILKYLALDEEPPSIHLYFGDAIHAAIETTMNEGWGFEKRIEFFSHRFKKSMNDNMRDTPEFKDTQLFLDQGAAILKNIPFESILQEYELVSVEEAIYEHIYGDFYFKGFIDIVLKNKKTNRYMIMDWKTSTELWNLKYKFEDEIFMMQMKLYKYFLARKLDLDLTKIDVKYMVLCRFKNKKQPTNGYGVIQEVDMTSGMNEVKDALELMAKTIQQIHIKQEFPKAKVQLDINGKPILDKEGRIIPNDKACLFCKYKGGKHSLCNSSLDQADTLLKENFMKR